MKKIYFFVVFVLFAFLTQGQQATAPTLSAGLDHVTYKPGTLDPVLIARIVSEKQQELVREGIKRMIFKTIGDSRLDDYSQFYIERVTEILFQEKNHKVMTKRILEESTNYLFVLGVTKLILDSKNKEFTNLFLENGYSLKKPIPKSLNKFRSLDNRNKAIKTILTICSEIPEIKELGLLNNYNYYEHLELYDKSFVKNIVNDCAVLYNIREKPKQIIDVTVTKYLREIEELTIVGIDNEEALSKFKDNIANYKKELLAKKNEFKRIKELKSEILRKEKLIKVLEKNNFTEEVNLLKEKVQQLKSEKKDSLKDKKIKDLRDRITLLESKIKLNDFNNLTDENVVSEERTLKLKAKIKDLTNYIIDKKINISIDNKAIIEKIITKSISSGKFEENLNNYLNIAKIVYYLKKVLNNSNVIKDIVKNSDVNIKDLKKEPVKIIANKYKDVINNNYALENLIFKGNSSSIDSNYNNINVISEQIKNLYDIDYDIIDVNEVIDEINSRVKSIKKIDEKNIESFFSLKNIETKIKNGESPLNEIINNLKSLNINTVTEQSNNTKGILLEKIKEKQSDLIGLNLKKTEEEIRTFKNRINYKSIDLKTTNQIKDYFNSIQNLTMFNSLFSDFKREYDFLNTFNNGIKNVNNYYKKARENYKILEAINHIIIGTNDYLEDIFFTEEKTALRTKLKEVNEENKKIIILINSLEEITPNDIPENFSNYDKLNTSLNNLKGKYILNKISSGNPKDLFLKIKKYLINNFTLKENIELSKQENKTAKKLLAFFIDKNLEDKLDNLEVLELLDSNFLSELTLLANKVDSSSDINKLIASLEFSTSVLLSYKITEHTEIFENFPDLNKLTDFLKFIGNIKELNRAETFAFLLKTMNDYEYLFANANSDKKLIPDLINSLRQYAIIDLENNLIEIDVASVLTHMLEKYQKDRRWSFYATVGLNQYWLNNDLKDDNGQLYSEFNAASEKIGAKFKIWNFNEKPLFEDQLIHKVKRKALVSDIYAMPYVSGLLYKIANTSGKNYDSANIGVALGLTFFNSLDFNVSYSVPMEGQVFKNSMFGVSFDIPLSEYLKRLKL